MDIIKHYATLFNQGDEEFFKNEIHNCDVERWMKEHVPVFECPDKDVERTYYFRYWTYRKHVKNTPEGYVITEFLPKVPWSGKHNTINAAVGHHIYEGRWLRDFAPLLDYISFFMKKENEDRAHQYSAWFVYAIYQCYLVTGKPEPTEALVRRLDDYLDVWEKTHGTDDGLFWSIDNYDAMEYSVSGTPEGSMTPQRGKRPTLNSYMCADALALSRLAAIAGVKDVEEKYLARHKELKALINKELFDGDFFKAYHYESDHNDAFKNKERHIPRELIGYIPWMFSIPESDNIAPFGYLGDESKFLTPVGLATTERDDPRYLYPVDHECLWNGYVWPFATSQTLTALIECIKNYPGAREKYTELFARLLKDYAKSHLIRKDGKTLPWIDEVLHPDSGDWSSRTILKDWGWREDKGGYERGKDYNHSTFSDLVISGTVGATVTEDGVAFAPIVPDEWSWFCVRKLVIRGDEYEVYYDKNGDKFGKGKGLTVVKNGNIL